MNARRLALTLASLAVAAPVFAQAAPAPTQPAGPAGEVQTAYKRLEPNVIKAAEKMPADAYQYRPTPEIRTYARIVNHITEAQFHTCTTLNGTAFDPKSVPSDTADKDTVLAGLKASFAECDKAYGALDGGTYTEVLTAGPTK